jgi:hypothetical protein
MRLAFIPIALLVAAAFVFAETPMFSDSPEAAAPATTQGVNPWEFKSVKANVSKAAFDKRVEAAQAQYDQATQKAQALLDKEVTAARVALKLDFDTALKQATQAGNLDDAIAIKKARGIIDSGEDLPATTQLPGKSLLLLGPSDSRTARAIGDGHIPYVLNMDTIESANTGLKNNWKGRRNVLMTHPFAEGNPCVMTRTLKLPANRKSRLVLELSHWNDWNLVVKGNGEVLENEIIGNDPQEKDWVTVNVDLTKFAGKKLILELQNAANGWSGEQGVWGSVEIVSD